MNKAEKEAVLSPFNIPGPMTMTSGMVSEWRMFIDTISQKYDVDKEEILVGWSPVPPSEPNCLVYVHFSGSLCTEYFRKNGKGRWVCWNYLHQVKGTSGNENTCDFRNGVFYK